MEAFFESLTNSQLGLTIIGFIAANFFEILGFLIYIGKNGAKAASNEVQLSAKCEAYVRDVEKKVDTAIKEFTTGLNSLNKKISDKIDESDFKKIEEVKAKQLEVKKNLEEVKHKLSIDEIIQR